jgi:hypothetical protein
MSTHSKDEYRAQPPTEATRDQEGVDQGFVRSKVDVVTRSLEHLTASLVRGADPVCDLL